MSEQNLLEEISNLRAAIRQYRNSPKNMITLHKPYPAQVSSCQPSYKGRGGSHRGMRGRLRGPIMNRTLIVNNNMSSNNDYVSTISTGARKLISKKIYEKELQQGNLTKVQKVEALKQAREKIRQKQLETRISKNQVRLDLVDRCVIDGDLFAISRFGSKLVPLSIPSFGEKEAEVQWNGHTYKRTKNGNLKLQGIKVFLKEQCRYFQKNGECQRGESCRYFHNANKVALCRSFMKGSCLRENCKLSHEVNEHNVPHCYYFMKGICKNEDCQFLHTNPEYKLICRPFAIGGYCLRGKNCQFTHSFECPDFQSTKTCPRGKNCKLTHIDTDNTDIKIAFNTLDPAVFELPDLTKSLDVNVDPRIKEEEVIEEDSYYDSDEEDLDTAMEDQDATDNGLDANNDFISF